ncbi:hypothetical protein D047_4964B, partial [Vibrio parahaemolyticus VPTS-2010_2]
KATIKV